MLTLSVLLAGAALAGGSSREAGPSHASPERRVACAVVDIASDSLPRRRHGFRATSTLGLEFETQLVGHVRRERQLQLRVYMPQGFLYQVLEVEVERAGRKRRRLEARLPVAGTSIMTSGLYGRWKVVPHLDGEREPCGPARRFVIRQ